MMRLLTLCLLYLACLATPASAGPVAAAISMAFTAIKGSVVLSALFKLAASVVLSKIAAALAPKPKQPGIKTESTLTGSQAPCSFVLGSYATAGVYVCPPMSHGTVGDYPNAYLTYVIELGDIAGQTLDQVIINGEVVPFGGTPHADYGLPVSSGKYLGKAWLKYYDGTQTAADPMLLAKYGSYPKRPWSADMVGRGTCYAILTFQYGRKVYSSFPTVRFVMGGIKLYDPRKDSTVGGSGTHRWATPSTWAATLNPMVMAYNIHRGISVGGHVWGGNASAAELPLSSWFAAMNACDALVDNGAGGTEPAFRAGFEVTVDMEPAAVLEDLMRACLGEVADVGGEWLVSAGDTALPVFLLTDDGIVTSQPGEQVPFPGPQDTFNAVLANYPDPAAGWEAQAAPPLYNATWESADGGRRLPVTLDYPAVPYAAQVQRLMRATIAQERRFVTHTEVLPPEALAYDVLDVGSWTSARHGYGAKLFQIGRTAEDLQTGLVQVTMRERDPADTAIPGAYFTPPLIVSAEPAADAAEPVVAEADLAPALVGRIDSVDAAAQQAVLDLDGIQTNVVGLRPKDGGAELELVPLSDPTGVASTARISAIEVTELLRLNADTAGFSLGKIGPMDPADGVYMGVLGAGQFGFAASRTEGLVRQSITLEPTGGLMVRNAKHRTAGPSLPITVDVTTSQTITLPVGTKWVTGLAIGGGGGGGSGDMSGSSYVHVPGSAGAATVVQICDGATVKATFTAPGGAGGGVRGSYNSGTAGAASVFGAGGVGSSSSTVAPSPGVNSGSGGGGGYGSSRGGLGGGAAAPVTIEEIDVSGYAAPKIVVTVGAGGAGGVEASTAVGADGAAGAPGRLRYVYSMVKEYVADVVTIEPTAVGSFAKAADALGDVFPDLGPGLWVIDSGTAPDLGIGTVEISGSATIPLIKDVRAVFIASKRPTIVVSNAGSRTINYLFYAMGQWGG